MPVTVFTADGQWPWPEGATHVWAYGLGAGGPGGQNTTAGQGGGGGAEFAAVFVIWRQNEDYLDIVVGQPSLTADGEDSEILQDSTVLLRAKGGKKAVGRTGGAGGSGGIGDLLATGGAGATSIDTRPDTPMGGGGGGGAGGMTGTASGLVPAGGEGGYSNQELVIPGSGLTQLGGEGGRAGGAGAGGLPFRNNGFSGAGGGGGNAGGAAFPPPQDVYNFGGMVTSKGGYGGGAGGRGEDGGAGVLPSSGVIVIDHPPILGSTQFSSGCCCYACDLAKDQFPNKVSAGLHFAQGTPPGFDPETVDHGDHIRLSGDPCDPDSTNHPIGTHDTNEHNTILLQTVNDGFPVELELTLFTAGWDDDQQRHYCSGHFECPLLPAAIAEIFTNDSTNLTGFPITRGCVIGPHPSSGGSAPTSTNWREADLCSFVPCSYNASKSWGDIYLGAEADLNIYRLWSTGKYAFEKTLVIRYISADYYQEYHTDCDPPNSYTDPYAYRIFFIGDDVNDIDGSFGLTASSGYIYDTGEEALAAALNANFVLLDTTTHSEYFNVHHDRNIPPTVWAAGLLYGDLLSNPTCCGPGGMSGPIGYNQDTTWQTEKRQIYYGEVDEVTMTW